MRDRTTATLKRLVPNASVLTEPLQDGHLPDTLELLTNETFSRETHEVLRQALAKLDGTFERNQRPGTFELMPPDRFAGNVLAALPERISLLGDALLATAGKLDSVKVTATRPR